MLSENEKTVFGFIESHRDDMIDYLRRMVNIDTQTPPGLNYDVICELGASAMEIGYVNSVGGFASTLITLPVGWLADRYGIKRMLLTALPLMAVGYAVFGLAHSWEITMVALVLTSLSTDMAFVVCPMICGNTYLLSQYCFPGRHPSHDSHVSILSILKHFNKLLVKTIHKTIDF